MQHILHTCAFSIAYVHKLLVKTYSTQYVYHMLIIQRYHWHQFSFLLILILYFKLLLIL